MIFTESTIKISNNVSKMDSTIVLYRGDKNVDDKVTSLPQLSFNEAGELVVTINGVSKTFVPKNV